VTKDPKKGERNDLTVARKKTRLMTVVLRWMLAGAVRGSPGSEKKHDLFGLEKRHEEEGGRKHYYGEERTATSNNVETTFITGLPGEKRGYPAIRESRKGDDTSTQFYGGRAGRTKVSP